LLMFGFSVSIMYRWADQKKREVQQKESGESGSSGAEKSEFDAAEDDKEMFEDQLDKDEDRDKDKDRDKDQNRDKDEDLHKNQNRDKNEHKDRDQDLADLDAPPREKEQRTHPTELK